MDPVIKASGERYFIGLRKNTTLEDEVPGSLWRAFMPRRREVKDALTSQYYAIQLYPDLQSFTPQCLFEKWAAVEVPSRKSSVPAGMALLTVPPGTYAWFIHKGTPDGFSKTLHDILHHWLPLSDYTLDVRPHMEVMDDHYDPRDPAAKEEVWIPVRLRVSLSDA